MIKKFLKSNKLLQNVLDNFMNERKQSSDHQISTGVINYPNNESFSLTRIIVKLLLSSYLKAPFLILVRNLKTDGEYLIIPFFNLDLILLLTIKASSPIK